MIPRPLTWSLVPTIRIATVFIAERDGRRFRVRVDPGGGATLRVLSVTTYDLLEQSEHPGATEAMDAAQAIADREVAA